MKSFYCDIITHFFWCLHCDNKLLWHQTSYWPIRIICHCDHVMSQRVMFVPICKQLMNMCNQTFSLAVDLMFNVKARSCLGFDSQSVCVWGGGVLAILGLVQTYAMLGSFCQILGLMLAPYFNFEKFSWCKINFEHIFPLCSYKVDPYFQHPIHLLIPF